MFVSAVLASVDGAVSEANSAVEASVVASV